MAQKKSLYVNSILIPFGCTLQPIPSPPQRNGRQISIHIQSQIMSTNKHLTLFLPSPHSIVSCVHRYSKPHILVPLSSSAKVRPDRSSLQVRLPIRLLPNALPHLVHRVRLQNKNAPSRRPSASERLYLFNIDGGTYKTERHLDRWHPRGVVLQFGWNFPPAGLPVLDERDDIPRCDLALRVGVVACGDRPKRIRCVADGEDMWVARGWRCRRVRSGSWLGVGGGLECELLEGVADGCGGACGVDLQRPEDADQPAASDDGGGVQPFKEMGVGRLTCTK
jgi:hypothetical protein